MGNHQAKVKDKFAQLREQRRRSSIRRMNLPVTPDDPGYEKWLEAQAKLRRVQSEDSREFEKLYSNDTDDLVTEAEEDTASMLSPSGSTSSMSSMVSPRTPHSKN